MAETIHVQGLRELQRAFRAAGGDLPRELRRELVRVGKPAESDARSRLSQYSTRSAGGIRARVRGGSTLVLEQRRGRVTGKRPDWGARQMRRALLPARAAHTQELIAGLEEMLDRLAGHNGF